jgi:hypothetical protein
MARATSRVLLGYICELAADCYKEWAQVDPVGIMEEYSSSQETHGGLVVAEILAPPKPGRGPGGVGRGKVAGKAPVCGHAQRPLQDPGRGQIQERLRVSLRWAA